MDETNPETTTINIELNTTIGSALGKIFKFYYSLVFNYRFLRGFYII